MAIDEECLDSSDKRKQVEMLWVQDPSQRNVENLNNVRREACTHIRNKIMAFLKGKFEELETNGKIKNIRDLCKCINDDKKGCQPRNNVVKDEIGNLVADSYSIVNRWRNYYPGN